jgi:hypothetical protein
MCFRLAVPKDAQRFWISWCHRAGVTFWLMQYGTLEQSGLELLFRGFIGVHADRLLSMIEAVATAFKVGQNYKKAM